MIRTFLLTAAVVCAVLAAGLLFKWGFWIFDELEWQADALGWLALAVASFAASSHPWADR